MPIDLAPPVAAAPSDPPVMADYGLTLPLRFSGREKGWALALPFMDWVPEPVAAGADPSYYDVPYLSVELLLLTGHARR